MNSPVLPVLGDSGHLVVYEWVWNWAYFGSKLKFYIDCIMNDVSNSDSYPENYTDAQIKRTYFPVHLLWRHDIALDIFQFQ